MVQLLEVETGFGEYVILYNDENTTEEKVLKCIEMGEPSSYHVSMTKIQYENIFKSKNSVIKEIVK